MAIPIRKLFFLQLFIVLFLILMHFFPERLSWTIHDKFNLDGEANIPTWYSTVLLFSVSLSSLGIYKLSFDHAHSRRFWLVFSCVYCFLSLDEAAGLHEVIDRTTSVKWVFVYAPFAGAFFMICAYHLVKSDNKTLRNWILSGLVVYVLGGLLGEFISYLFYPLPPLLQQLEFVLEEGFEMFGTIMVLMGCLQELNLFLDP
jgi:hypothetical protein